MLFCVKKVGAKSAAIATVVNPFETQMKMVIYRHIYLRNILYFPCAKKYLGNDYPGKYSVLNPFPACELTDLGTEPYQEFLP